MICALHQNPIRMELGVAVRTINILNIMGDIFKSSISLYTLANDNNIKNHGKAITEKHIGKPWMFRAMSGGYLCMFPLLIKRNLKCSELSSIEPRLTIFEGPFMAYATLKSIDFPSNSITVYDAHNVEIKYWEQYFGKSFLGRKILNQIRKIEAYVLERSDYVFVTSDYEKCMFVKEYGVDEKKIILVPNGVNTSAILPMDRGNKLVLRQEYEWNYAHCVVFMGSDVKSNIRAVEYIVSKLAKALPNVGFLIIGSVCQRFTHVPRNVKLLGILDDLKKNLILSMADMAINPVMTGAGTNTKMLEYMSAGLPIITTPVGARGLTIVNGQDVIVDDIEKFHDHICEIISNESLRENLERNSRSRAIEYDWDNVKRLIQSGFRDIS